MLLLLQLNEVVIGNVDGILAVFKGDLSTRTWRRATGLGTVRATSWLANKLSCDKLGGSDWWIGGLLHIAGSICFNPHACLTDYLCGCWWYLEHWKGRKCSLFLFLLFPHLSLLLLRLSLSYLVLFILFFLSFSSSSSSSSFFSLFFPHPLLKYFSTYLSSTECSSQYQCWGNLPHFSGWTRFYSEWHL